MADKPRNVTLQAKTAIEPQEIALELRENDSEFSVDTQPDNQKFTIQKTGDAINGNSNQNDVSVLPESLIDQSEATVGLDQNNQSGHN
ncbi:hypothetical protein H0H87_012793 [Tephrocybe sp. NHM501043]|nr:hypothetical protein H0H87_012793 [Tephrocybe sp. NHM501043]